MEVGRYVGDAASNGNRFRRVGVEHVRRDSEFSLAGRLAESSG
jgi:hypothetical protein